MITLLNISLFLFIIIAVKDLCFQLSLMSSLFGTVSENDLANIDRNIKALAGNQKRIIHDLVVSLSVLKLTRMQVSENRRSIRDLIIVVKKLDRKMFNL